jgi:aromatic ring-opening dioxygenase LigB subunit
MADNKQLQRQVQEASWGVVDSLRETTQAVANTMVSIQDHNLRLTQNIFLSWTDLLTQQQWEQQTQKRQDAYQKLASASMQAYMNFLFAPFSFSQQMLDVTEDIQKEERELALNAAL